MTESSSSKEQHLLTELAKTGFPLEIEVSDLLEKNWSVFNNQAYMDEDEGKTREIDIFAIHESETDQLRWVNPPRLFLATDLAVECKKSETHAWVFPTRTRNVPPGLGSGQTLDFLEVLSGGSRSFLEGLQMPRLHYDTTERIAYTGTPIKLKKDAGSKREDRDDIFEARNQLMKFSQDFFNGYRKRFQTDRIRRDIALLFLTIVFDGELYEARTESNEWAVTPTDHLLLGTGRYSKTTGDYRRFLIDVVTKRGFPEYLKLLNDDVSLVMNDIAFRSQALLGKADDAVKSLPSSFVFAKVS